MALPRLKLTSHFHMTEHYTEHRERMTLDAPYQRGSVWTDENRRLLIKSLIMGLPIGAIVLNHRGYDSEVIYSVIDGKQRIETLWAFVDDKFQVPADWFEPDWVEASDATTVSYGDLSMRGQRGIDNMGLTTLVANVEGIAAEAEIYTLINTAGVEQTDADLANASRVAHS